MKKKKLGIVASSVAAIAVCSSMVVGSTFALFTSESKVDIAVTAGKVNVTATVENVETYSMNEKQEAVEVTQNDVKETHYMFENGGFASVNGNGLKINNVTAEDEVRFEIRIANNSNVNVQYRTKVSVEKDNGLAEGLVVTIDSKEFTASAPVYTNWSPLAANVSPENTVKVSVKLPDSEDVNKYNGLEGETVITYAVEAVQGNAEVKNENETIVKTEEEFVAAVQETKDNSVILLANNITLTKEFSTPNEHSGRTITIKGTDKSVVLDNSIYTVTFGGLNVKYENITLTADAKNSTYKPNYWYCMFSALHTASVEYTDCIFPSGVITYNSGKATFKKCVFSSNERNESKYSLWHYAGTEINVIDCEFNSPNGYAMKVYSENTDLNAVVNVTNCKFNTEVVNKSALEIDATYSTYTVNLTDCKYSGNFIENHYKVSGSKATVNELNASDIQG